MATTLKVLLADDHEIHRMLLTRLFTALGCHVTAVSDGAEALAQTGDFDLICLDRHMPGPSGPEVAAALRGRAFLLACTSDLSPGLHDFNMLMAKPIRCADVARAVKAATWAKQCATFDWRLDEAGASRRR